MNAGIDSAALAIAAVLFDSLWQGALIAATVWLALRCLPSAGASTRYAVWLCALVALAVVPVATVALGGRHVAPPAFSGPAAVMPRAASIDAVAPTGAQPARGTAAAALAAAGVVAEVQEPVVPSISHITLPGGLALAIMLAWLLVAGARTARLAVGLRRLGELRHGATSWSRAYDYPVLVSERVAVPLALGFHRKAVLLPLALAEQLDASALESVIAHEVAHLRRGDVWTNTFARVIEALAAFNPAAWFIVRALATEREIACDDCVVARTGSGDDLAAVLAHLACGVRSRAPLAAPSVLGSRHTIVLRIERLLDGGPRRVRLSRPALGAALAALAGVALCVQSVSPVLAYDDTVPPVAQATATSGGGACTDPNRGIAFAVRHAPGAPPTSLPLNGYVLHPARELVARYGAANVVTFDLTVDAAGRTRALKIVSAPYPRAGQIIALMLTHGRYQPALRNCVPVTAMIRSAVRLGETYANSLSTVDPVYPAGWSARHPGACKVPELLRSDLPPYPPSMSAAALGRSYDVSVRVHVDPAGHAGRAAVVRSSGQPAFDRAVVAAAQAATYPLTGAFKPVRPSGTSLAWNAAHGPSTYVNCTPPPADYVWNTSFSRERSFLLTDKVSVRAAGPR